MLVVGENAYCTVAEADELIKRNFISINHARKFWESLENDDKETLIIGSTEQYDRDDFFYKGYKKEIDQPLQFPRYIDEGDLVECPNNIKIGIILTGCRDYINESNTASEMRMQGIKTFQDGTGAKIEFADKSSASREAVKNVNGIYMDIWDKYFKQYTLLI